MLEEKHKVEIYNLDAEMVLLGGILVNNQQLDRVSEFLTPDSFYMPLNGKIYGQIVKMREREMVANQITLTAFAENDENIKNAGGADYLRKLAASSIGWSDIKPYAELIADLATKRKLIEIGQEIIIEANNPEAEDAANQIEQAESRLFTLATDGNKQGEFMHLSIGIKESIARAHLAKARDTKLSGISTGFSDLDKELSGLQKSDLLILGGRPSMGKTALALNIAFNAAANLRVEADKSGGKPPIIAFFSLEMSSDQLATRIISMKTGLHYDTLNRGYLTNDDFAKLDKAALEIAQLELYIDDTPALTIAAIRSRARRLSRRYQIGAIVIDYLQLIRGSNNKNENKVQEISEVTQGLKTIAKELKTPLLALAQLSRAVEQREDKRPQLSDLRESGAIEQDADVVMFIYRESYYLERKKPAENDVAFTEWQAKSSAVHNLAEVIIAKHRNGPIGTVNLFFNPEETKFTDLRKMQ